MNNRAQGGSSLEPGAIEFMQNRRIAADDKRGMDEWLDETDSNGNGIKVPATYFVHLGNQNVTDSDSVQRRVQMRTDDPAQYFFSFNMT